MAINSKAKVKALTSLKFGINKKVTQLAGVLWPTHDMG